MAVEIVEPAPLVVETQPSIDSVPVVDGEAPPPTLVNGHINEVASGSEQIQVQVIRPPKIFDMDLEKMNAELYKGRYLTPADFLDDVRKIVQNATTRMHEDSDRLFKAHAMLTAAEVSIHDFEPQLRIECERMAVRERKRRAERREARIKARAAADGPAQDPQYPPGTRRSARNVGAPLDIAFTDPLLIERRSKRQRSSELAAESPASGADAGEVRTAKRSRLASEDGPDPLDVISVRTSPPLAVRFEEDAGTGELHVSGDTAVPPPVEAEAETMTVTVEPSNPVTTTIPSRPSSSAMQTSAGNTPSEPPSTLPATSGEEPPLSDVSVSRTETQTHASPPAMDIVREPTPLPDFVVDEGKLDALRAALVQQTDGLSVEELEQLRASCLSCVWRHRADWDRGSLLDDLRALADEFIEEVRIDEDGTTPPP